MAKVITTELQHSGASAANITLDSSKNVTCENNLQVDGNVTVTGTLPADKLTGNLPAISGASLTGLPSSPPAGRNILINGDMRIAQRGTSSTEQGCKTTDRFYYDKGGTNETPQQEQRALTSADTGPWAKGFRWCYKITNGNQSALDATDYVRFKYITENRDIHQSGWEYTDPNSKVTISFWVKSSVSQRFYFALRTSEGTGQHYAHPFTPAANTWTYVTHTIPGNANNVFGDNNGHGLMLQWQLAIGSSYTDDSFTDDAWGNYVTNQFKDYNDGDNDWYETDNATWEITGVQFEAGDTATDFEFKRYADELARCQRYYFKFLEGNTKEMAVGWYYHNQHISFILRYPTTMRAVPTGHDVTGTNYYIIYKNNGYDTFDGFVFENGSTEQYSCYNNSDMDGDATHPGIVRSYNANAKIEFDAELLL